ncbi:MAG: oxidation-sensing regulator MosR [Parasphingorhabdus sp.]
MTSDPSACANMNIRRAARQIGQFFDDRMSGADIRATQFSLLVLVGRHAPAPISHIAEAIKMERTTLTRNLHVLERQGMVEAQAGTDARMRLYSLTEQGKKAVQDTQSLWSEAQSDFLSRFGERRWEALRAELKALEACL